MEPDSPGAEMDGEEAARFLKEDFYVKLENGEEVHFNNDEEMDEYFTKTGYRRNLGIDDAYINIQKYKTIADKTILGYRLRVYFWLSITNQGGHL